MPAEPTPAAGPTLEQHTQYAALQGWVEILERIEEQARQALSVARDRRDRYLAELRFKRDREEP